MGEDVQESVEAVIAASGVCHRTSPRVAHERPDKSRGRLVCHSGPLFPLVDLGAFKPLLRVVLADAGE